MCFGWVSLGVYNSYIGNVLIEFSAIILGFVGVIHVY